MSNILGLALIAIITLILIGSATYAVVTDKLDRFEAVVAGGVVGLMILYLALGFSYGTSVW